MVELTDEEVGTLLSFGVHVDVCDVVVLQALVTADVVGFEDGEWMAGKAADVDLVWAQALWRRVRNCCRPTRRAVAAHPNGLLFDADHGKHLGRDVVGALNAAVGIGVVGAGVNLVDPKAVANGASEL